MWPEWRGAGESGNPGGGPGLLFRRYRSWGCASRNEGDLEEEAILRESVNFCSRLFYLKCTIRPPSLALAARWARSWEFDGAARLENEVRQT